MKKDAKGEGSAPLSAGTDETFAPDDVAASGTGETIAHVSTENPGTAATVGARFESGNVATDATVASSASAGGGGVSVSPSGPAAELWGALPVVDSKHYAILSEFARGGLGRILRARDKRTGRYVAIKEMLRGTADAAARFKREALVTANLQHPAIVPVYEVGRWPSGEPFYAMKMVAGRSLDDVTRDARTLDERLALLPHVIAVAEALAYAHGERIIHRDIKPANVLVGAYGETVVIDWGLAKDLSKADDDAVPVVGPRRLPAGADSQTIAGSIMGTPAYMPPEQAAGEAVDERADVYALGAILYEVLSGQMPYAGSRSAEETLENVLRGPPRPLDELQAGIPSDLLAIVEKALAHKKEARYLTAKELAEDLRRFQTGQLVAAHSYTTWALIGRWVKRHRTAITVGALALVILAVVGVLSVRSIVRERDHAERERVQAVEARAEAEKQREAADRAREEAVRRQRETEEAKAEAQKSAKRAEAERVIAERQKVIADDERAAAVKERQRAVAAKQEAEKQRLVAVAAKDEASTSARTATARLASLFEEQGREEFLKGEPARAFAYLAEAYRYGRTTAAVKYLIGRALNPPVGLLGVLEGHRQSVLFGAFHPSGRRLATGDSEGRLIIWDTDRMRALHKFDRVGAPTAYSATGDRLLTVNPAKAMLWETASMKLLANIRLRERETPFRAVFSPDGSVIAIGGFGGTVMLLDAVSFKQSKFIQAHRSAVGVRFSPDGKRLLTTGAKEKVARLWDVPEGKLVAELSGHTNLVRNAWFSPDGRHVVTASHDHTARIWTAEGTLLRKLEGHRGEVAGASFSPDGRKIATASDDGTIRVWDTATGTEAFKFVGTGGEFVFAAFSPDGRWIVAGGVERHQFVLSASDGRLVGKLDSGGAASFLEFAPDGQRLASAGMNKRVFFWDSRELRDNVLRGHKARLRPGRFTPDGQRVATTSDDKTVRLWNARAGRFIRSFIGHTDAVVDIAFNRDGSRAVTGSRDRTARVWNVATGKSVQTLRHDDTVRSVQFSADDSRILTGSKDKTARVWDAETGKLLLTLNDESPLAMVKFSPDGTKILTGVDGLIARVWDAKTGARIAHLLTQSSTVTDVAWSPDSRFVAVAEPQGSVGVLKVASKAVATRLSGNFYGGAWSVDFSPESNHVLTASTDGVARVWDVATGKQLLALVGSAKSLIQARYRPDGKLIATVGMDRIVRIWDAETGRVLEELNGHRADVYYAAFSPKGDRLVTSGLESVARLWSIGEWSGDAATLDAWRKCRVPWELRNGTLVPAALDPTACPKLPKQLR